MAWAISYTETATRQLSKLDRPTARRILDFMDARIAPLTETLIVTRVKRGSRARNLVHRTMQLSRFEVVPVDAAMAELAYDAFEIYGKGSGHAAQLNFGDTFSCALAKVKNVPLLFKGNNFSLTDVQSAA